MIEAAVDAGIKFLDTADVYGGAGASETIIGKALAGGLRDRVVIGTKFAAPFDGDPPGRGAGAAWITQAVEGSLRRLQTDRIDLYQQHVYDAVGADRGDPGRARRPRRRRQGARDRVEQLRRRQIDAAATLSAERAWPAFASVQNRFSLLDREALDDAIPACERLGIAFLPFFPLASGMLTGKYRADAPFPPGTRLADMPAERAASFASDRNHRLVAALDEVATSRGHTLLELAFAWLTAQPADRLRHRRGHLAGADRRQRRGRRLDALAPTTSPPSTPR